MIYLIDNDKYIRRAFELFFRSTLMEYKSFENADEFISNYKPDRGDIVVMDWMMPGLQGCDLLEEFDKRNLHVPVIIVSSIDDPKYREECKKHGVKAFLRKPVDIEALYDIIRFNLPS